MSYILILGAALNYFAALKLLAESYSQARSVTGVEDYLFLKVFVGGVAVTFGSLYVYLFNHMEQIIPFLIFGAALKSWAFLISVFLVISKHIGTRLFVELGLSNGIVAGLFWWLILQSAG